MYGYGVEVDFTRIMHVVTRYHQRDNDGHRCKCTSSVRYESYEQGVARVQRSTCTIADKTTLACDITIDGDTYASHGQVGAISYRFESNKEY